MVDGTLNSMRLERPHVERRRTWHEAQSATRTMAPEAFTGASRHRLSYPTVTNSQVLDESEAWRVYLYEVRMDMCRRVLEGLKVRSRAATAGPKNDLHTGKLFKASATSQGALGRRGCLRGSGAGASLELGKKYVLCMLGGKAKVAAVRFVPAMLN